ncbi:MFS transporter [Streptomyces sp. HC307]|uniref:MFS transporter n=1 Tax=Streptomyces flavusporus TaxID=3385496 RepID=UPI0039176379
MPQGTGRAQMLALCLVNFLVALEFSIVNVALPALQQDLDIQATTAQWILSGYALAFGSALLCGGRVADLLGARRVLLAGLLAFVATSAAAAAAPNFALLAACRVSQGASAAAATPAALGLVTRLFAGPDRLRALSWWGAAASLGFACGAVFGGVLTGVAGWRSIFLACAALGCVAIALVRFRVPDLPRAVGAQPDWLGAVQMALCGAALIMTLSLAPRAQQEPGLLLLSGIAATMLATALVFRRRRHPAPLIPHGFLTRRVVLQGNLFGAWAAAAGGSMVYFATSLMQSALHWSDAVTGLMLLPDAAAAAVGARVAAPLSRRLGRTQTCRAGLAAILTGMVVLAATPLDAAAVGVLVLGTSLVGFGLVLVAVVASMLASDGLQEGEHGLSGGVLMTTQQLGVSIGLGCLLLVAQLAPGTPTSVGSIRACFLAGAGLAALACLRIASASRSKNAAAADAATDA